MSKFTSTTKGVNITNNKAGGKSYKINDKTNLVIQVMTSLINEKKYYGDNTKDLINLIRSSVKNDPEFVAKLGIYARTKMNLRSVSQVILGELANISESKYIARKAIRNTISRVDDMTELMGYYLSTFSKPIPNSLKKGINDVLPKFDEYQLAKYKGKNKNISLKDLLCLCHPKPRCKEVSDLYKKILEDDLSIPETWETKLSSVNNKNSKQQKWEELICNKSLGYMASLRNLRNILQENVSDDALNMLLNYITNEKAIINSKQFPFRFLSAFNEISKLNNNEIDVYRKRKVLDAIENALELSGKNIPHFEGKTFFISDNSGSMTSQLSNKSSITYQEISNLLMCLGSKFCDENIISIFAEYFKLVNVSSKSSIMDKLQTINNMDVGYMTNLYLAFKWLCETKTKVDRIVVFSDMQAYCSTVWDCSDVRANNYLNMYRNTINPNVWVHSIDLTGYGTSQFYKNDPKVHLIGGWSEKVLEFVKLVENGTSSIIDEINKIELK